MSALRQGAAQIARRSRPTAVRTSRRSYASGHGHDEHHHSAGADEALGMQFYIAVGAVPVSYIIYSISRPTEDGQKGWVGDLIQKYANLSQEWETRNALRTAAIEQAAHDKHLLYNAPRNRHVDLKFPEGHFHAGAPYNVPAGHNVDLTHVVEHYKNKHLDEEERKARKVAAAMAAA